VFGRLRSLPLTFLGAVVLALAQNFSALELHGPGWSRVTLSLPGIFLFAALLLLPEAKLTVGRMVGRRSPATPGLTASLARAALFVGAVVMVARVAPGARVADITLALVYGVLLLSLVALTGLSGQISLCQYVFLALGAWAMGSLGGGSTFGGLVAAAAVCVPVGLLVALPAIRLQGLYLALVTFGFAVISQTLVFDDPHIFGRHNVAVGRPRLLGVDFAGDRAFLALCGAAFAVVAEGVLAIKRGPIGRRLAAMRDSQAACATLGLDVRRQKLLIFAVSAAIAGLAGALYGGQQTTAGGTIQFQPVNNIVLFLFAVVGGITTVSGALIGGALFALLPLLQSQHQQWAGLVFAAIAAAAIGLGRQPNGIAGMVYERFARVGRRPEVTAAPARAPADLEVTGAPA
jgi:branched-chain amino acid transport system permease protein